MRQFRSLTLKFQAKFAGKFLSNSSLDPQPAATVIFSFRRRSSFGRIATHLNSTDFSVETEFGVG